MAVLSGETGRQSGTAVPPASELVTTFENTTTAPIWQFGRSVTYNESPFMTELYRPEVLKEISSTIEEYRERLWKLSSDIHANPELAFKERFAHDTLSDFMEEVGFCVTRHYLGMETAWKASFTHSNPGRVIGLNSEMDALPGIGHACGHNLIAIAGVAMALGIKAAMVRHTVPGTIVLLGTPGEEVTGGKTILLERGAYKEMDACLMVHPFSGPFNSIGVGTTTAHQAIEAEYTGRTAHAAGGPWQGKNALDAAVLAYSAISAFRQQMEPGMMTHGTINGREWIPNVIPDYAKLSWRIRARTASQLGSIRERIIKCFEGAALQADCAVTFQVDSPWCEVRQNTAIALDFVANAAHGFGMDILSAAQSTYTASTDFGSVTYELPAVHAVYSELVEIFLDVTISPLLLGIPAEINGANHTPSFARSAMTQEAFEATLATSKALAMSGFRILDDDDFFGAVRMTFEKERSQMLSRL
ncbi:hypothetical protein M422DRAFT_240377 [Sphaerobolus stellatus SS14]|nr:hypothetical protein M422DRAFT_240377 [Sphaerobolus stellatus SS14]